MFIYSYHFASESAKAIAEALGLKRIKHKNSKFKGKVHKTVINWGSSTIPPEVDKCRVLNRPEVVATVANKLKFFQCMRQLNKDDDVPEWTTDPKVAEGWHNDKHIVCVRHKLTGNSGDGLVVVEVDHDWKDEYNKAPLFTKYVFKSDEYRVHVVGGEVIDVQRKARKLDVPDQKVNWRIRNHDNGFIFARGNLEAPQRVMDLAKNCCENFGLDIAGVDVLYRAKENKAMILEVNSAPGIEGTTVEKYAKALRKLL